MPSFMTTEFIMQVVIFACAGVGQYVAIRADLVAAKHRADTAEHKAEVARESASECHARLDRHIEVKH